VSVQTTCLLLSAAARSQGAAVDDEIPAMYRDGFHVVARSIVDRSRHMKLPRSEAPTLPGVYTRPQLKVSTALSLITIVHPCCIWSMSSVLMDHPQQDEDGTCCDRENNASLSS
jgi:hypothetical protein